MSIRVVQTGREPLIEDAFDWLASKGLPARLINTVDLHAQAGDAMTLTVKLYVDTDPVTPEGLREQASELLTRANEMEGRDPAPDIEQIKADILKHHLGEGWHPVQ